MAFLCTANIGFGFLRSSSSAKYETSNGIFSLVPAPPSSPPGPVRAPLFPFFFSAQGLTRIRSAFLCHTGTSLYYVPILFIVHTIMLPYDNHVLLPQKPPNDKQMRLTSTQRRATFLAGITMLLPRGLNASRQHITPTSAYQALSTLSLTMQWLLSPLEDLIDSGAFMCETRASSLLSVTDTSSNMLPTLDLAYNNVLLISSPRKPTCELNNIEDDANAHYDILTLCAVYLGLGVLSDLVLVFSSIEKCTHNILSLLCTPTSWSVNFSPSRKC